MRLLARGSLAEEFVKGEVIVVCLSLGTFGLFLLGSGGGGGSGGFLRVHMHVCVRRVLTRTCCSNDYDGSSGNGSSSISSGGRGGGRLEYRLGNARVGLILEF